MTHLSDVHSLSITGRTCSHSTVCDHSLVNLGVRTEGPLKNTLILGPGAVGFASHFKQRPKLRPLTSAELGTLRNVETKTLSVQLQKILQIRCNRLEVPRTARNKSKLFYVHFERLFFRTAEQMPSYNSLTRFERQRILDAQVGNMFGSHRFDLVLPDLT